MERRRPRHGSKGIAPRASSGSWKRRHSLERLEDRRVLNVGPMFETRLLRDAGATVDTLGFPHPLFPPGEGERHISCDLNDRAEPGDGSYDLVVAGEVIDATKVRADEFVEADKLDQRFADQRSAPPP